MVSSHVLLCVLFGIILETHCARMIDKEYPLTEDEVGAYERMAPWILQNSSSISVVDRQVARFMGRSESLPSSAQNISFDAFIELFDAVTDVSVYEASTTLVGDAQGATGQPDHISDHTIRNKKVIPFNFLFIVQGVLVVATITGDLIKSSPILQSAYVVAFLASAHQACMNELVHHGSFEMALGFGVLAFVRSAFLAIGSIAMAKLRPNPVTLWPTDWDVQLKVLARGVVGNSSVLLVFLALTYAPAPYVAVIYSAKSIWASILCWFMLGESLEMREIMGIFVGFVAVVLVTLSTLDAEPDDRLNPTMGLIIAGAASLMAACITLSIRSMKNGEVHHLTLVCSMGFTGLIFSVPVAIAFPHDFQVLFHLTTKLFILLCAVGISSFFMQLCVNKSCLLAKGGPVNQFTSVSSIVLQFLVDTVLGYHFNLMAWTGLMVILLYMAFQFYFYWQTKHLEKKRPAPKDSHKADVPGEFQPTLSQNQPELARADSEPAPQEKS